MSGNEKLTERPSNTKHYNPPTSTRYFSLHIFLRYIRIRSHVGVEYVQAPRWQYFTSELGQTLLLPSNNSCNGLHTALLLIHFVFGLITLVFCTLCCIIIHSASWLEPAMFHSTNFVLIIDIILIKFMVLIKWLLLNFLRSKFTHYSSLNTMDNKYGD
jgi:hypothetical protein